MWANRPLFALDADVTVYWPTVRPCWEEGKMAKCGTCGGSGTITIPQQPYVDHTGKVVKGGVHVKRCPACKGTGKK